MRRAFYIALGTLLTANLLDVSTSLIPAPIDRDPGIPARSPAAWAIQLALVVVLLAWTAPRVGAALRFVRALPVPRVALGVMATAFAVQLAHVLLRAERYPFSSVAMFSTAVRANAPPVWIDRVYLLSSPGRPPEPLSFLREGSPWFARYFDMDYKAGWALRLYGSGSSAAYEMVRAQLAERHVAPPAIATIAYRRSDGVIVGVRRFYP